jgi:hypothetical protein
MCAGVSVLAALAAGCSAPPVPAPTTSGGSTTAVSCPRGAANEPPEIDGLRLESGSAVVDPVSLPELVVPFTASSAVGSSLLRISVSTSTLGAPVTFSTTAGHVVERDSESWLLAPSAITVFSAAEADGSCRASAYLAVTKTGRARVTVSAKNTKTFAARVITVPEAARTVAMTLPRTRVLAGARITGNVAVRDGFGNPVLGMPVIVTVSGPGRVLPRGTTTTVTTDPRGRASFELGTAKDADGDITVTARLEWGGCATTVADGAAVGIAQVECPADVPVPGFVAGVREVVATVPVVRPNATLISPAADTELTQGEPFEVIARTDGIAPGTPATIELGEATVATGTVAAGAEGSVEGTVTVSVIADLDPLGGGYRLLVADTEPVIVPVEVRPFAITLITRERNLLVMAALPGALPAGTPVRLLRGDTEVAVTPVDVPGVPVTFAVALRPGRYNIAAVTPDGAQITGAIPQVVER